MTPAARRAARWTLAAYALVLAAALLWPSPIDRPAAGLLRGLIVQAHRLGADWVSYRGIEWSANVLLFVPLGLLLVLVLPTRRWWLAPAIGLTVSSAAELTQALLLPARVPSLLDVLANTIGTLIGAVAGVLLCRMLSTSAGDARS